MGKLTDKQQAFVWEYIQSLSATDAARRAGYQGTYDSLRVIGSQNLRKDNVRAAIAAALGDGQDIRNERVKQEKRIKVYLIRAENGLVKIGKTANVDSRFKALSYASSVELELLHVFDTMFGDELEETLHAQYAEKRVRGEWFRLTDADVRNIVTAYGQSNR